MWKVLRYLTQAVMLAVAGVCFFTGDVAKANSFILLAIAYSVMAMDR